MTTRSVDLSDFTVSGLKKSKTETVIDEIEIKKGQKITENFIYCK